MAEKKTSEEGCFFCGLTSIARNTHFAEHLDEAKKELWLAIRSVIDARIESLGGEKSDTKPARKVKIE